jgi:hypothetical protein
MRGAFFHRIGIRGGHESYYCKTTGTLNWAAAFDRHLHLALGGRHEFLLLDLAYECNERVSHD